MIHQIHKTQYKWKCITWQSYQTYWICYFQHYRKFNTIIIKHTRICYKQEQVYITFHAGLSICWKSKLQNEITLTTTEAKENQFINISSHRRNWNKMGLRYPKQYVKDNVQNPWRQTWKVPTHFQKLQYKIYVLSKHYFYKTTWTKTTLEFINKTIFQLAKTTIPEFDQVALLQN
jgi:hypothetical protein